MTQEEFNKYTWNKKWPLELLQSPELMSRRKRFHDVNILSINQERAFGVFFSDRDQEQTYTATLTSCTCKDFALGHGKYLCKHIFRLAEEMKLFQTEDFAPDVPSERKILPEKLYFASDELIEEYISILRFIFRGRKIRIKKFEKILSDLNYENF